MAYADVVEKTLQVGEDGQLQRVDQFKDPSLRDSMASALSGLTSRSVLLQLEKNDSGLNAVVAARINGHWSIAGAYRRDDWGDALATSVKFDW